MNTKYPTTLQISIIFPKRIRSASSSRMQAIDWCCRETFRLIIQNHFHIPSISLFVLFSPFIRQTHFKLSTNWTARGYTDTRHYNASNAMNVVDCGQSCYKTIVAGTVWLFVSTSMLAIFRCCHLPHVRRRVPDYFSFLWMTVPFV